MLGSGRISEMKNESEFTGCPVPQVAGASEYIDSKTLALRWNVPESWIRDYTRVRCADPIPCTRFGKYVRFRWNSPELLAWVARHTK